MRYIWNLGKLVLMIFLYGFAVRSSMAVRGASGTATALLTGGQPGAKEAAAIREQELEQSEPQRVCFWGEVPDTALTCQLTGKHANARQMVVSGDSTLLLPETGQLAWREDGCYLDTQTADELFGTESASGQLVTCGERVLTVLGTFESLQKLLVRSAVPGDGEQLTAVSLHDSDPNRAKCGLEEFLLRHGLEGTCMDFVFLSALVQNFLAILPLLLGLQLLRLLLAPGLLTSSEHGKRPGKNRQKKMHRDRKMIAEQEKSIEQEKYAEQEKSIEQERYTEQEKDAAQENAGMRKPSYAVTAGSGQTGGNETRPGKVLTWILCAVLSCGLVFLTARFLEIPSDMIPTRWSDFSFWSDWWQRQRQNLLLLLGTAQGEAQLELLWNALQAVIFGLAAIFLGAGTIRRNP